ncbi:unnamed protein product [Cylicostephanus goldi]|uniref:Uncharacterized protein n=1 Tax=Cylicostephanus goldi TaxID=71465 RepID=A0A3P6R8Z6_CYLGO|nr:unnamed protein product [Cylicostephanus goldi]
MESEFNGEQPPPNLGESQHWADLLVNTIPGVRPIPRRLAQVLRQSERGFTCPWDRMPSLDAIPDFPGFYFIMQRLDGTHGCHNLFRCAGVVTLQVGLNSDFYSDS